MDILKKIQDFSFSSSFAKKSRLLAIGYVLIELIVISIILMNYDEFSILAIITHSIFFLFGIILIIKPHLLVLWAMYFMIEGFAILWISEKPLGLIFLLTGIFFFIKLDFFRKHKRYKVFALISFFFLAIFMFYFKNNFKMQYSHIIDLVMGVSLCASIFVLLHDDLRKYYTKKPSVNLEDIKLSERQKACIEGVLKGKSLKAIATSLYVSESVVKREVKIIYDIFGVENHKELLKFFNTHDVIL